MIHLSYLDKTSYMTRLLPCRNQNPASPALPGPSKASDTPMLLQAATPSLLSNLSLDSISRLQLYPSRQCRPVVPYSEA